MEYHVQGHRRLSNRWPRGEDDEFAVLESPAQRVEIREPGGNAAQVGNAARRARIHPSVDFSNCVLNCRRLTGDALFRDLEDFSFGVSQEFLCRLAVVVRVAQDDVN